MKPNEHPFAFAIFDTPLPIIQPTLWELVEVAEAEGIYAPDFFIHPIYRNTPHGIIEPPVDPNVYSYQEGDIRYWREGENIKTIAMSRYYVPTVEMVIDLRGDNIDIYPITDMMLAGIDVICWIGAAKLGLQLAQRFPYHSITYSKRTAHFRVAVISAERK